MIDNIVKKLADHIKKYDKVAVAVDADAKSAILLNAAVTALGNKNVLAMIPHSEFTTESSLETAKHICSLADVDYVTTAFFLSDEPLAEVGSPLRCYYCQRIMYSQILHEAWLKGVHTVLCSLCKNDSRDCIAGLLAITELTVACPFIEAGIDEEAIICALSTNGEIHSLSCANMPV